MNLGQTMNNLLELVHIEHTRSTSARRQFIADTAKRTLDKESKLLEKYSSILGESKEKFDDENYLDEYSPDNAIVFQNALNDFRQEVRQLLSDVCNSLEGKTEAEKRVSSENMKLRTDLKRFEADLIHYRQTKEAAVAEKNTIAATCQKLQEQLDQKSKSILDLQREGTVSLWKREKEKLTVGLKSRENVLETKIRRLQEDHENSTHRMKEKIHRLQSQLSLHKMNQSRGETTRERSYTSMSSHGSNSSMSTHSGSIGLMPPVNYTSIRDVVEIKRQLFHTERTLIVASSELRKQQHYFCGIVRGIEKDLDLIKSKSGAFIDPKDKDFVKFWERLSNIVQSVEEGQLSSVRKGLPGHYQGLTLLPSSLKNETVEKSEKLLKSDLTQDLEYSDSAMDGLKNEKVNPSLLRWREGNDAQSKVLFDVVKDVRREHPSLVSEDGDIHWEVVARYFPDLIRDKVNLYHAIFTKIDTNYDGKLDTTEILQNVPYLLGKRANMKDISEVLDEVDKDNSGTIDFFEFLLFSQKLEKGAATSKLFRRRSTIKRESECG